MCSISLNQSSKTILKTCRCKTSKPSRYWSQAVKIEKVWKNPIFLSLIWINEEEEILLTTKRRLFAIRCGQLQRSDYYLLRFCAISLRSVNILTVSEQSLFGHISDGYVGEIVLRRKNFHLACVMYSFIFSLLNFCKSCRLHANLFL